MRPYMFSEMTVNVIPYLRLGVYEYTHTYTHLCIRICMYVSSEKTMTAPPFLRQSVYTFAHTRTHTYDSHMYVYVSMDDYDDDSLYTAIFL